MLRSKAILSSLTLMSLSVCAWAQTSQVTLAQASEVVEVEAEAIPEPSPSPSPSVRSASGIYFSSLVPDDQFQEFDRDLKELGAIPITDPDSKLKSILQLNDLSPSALLGWIKERVHFIVEDTFDGQSDFSILEEGFEFPNPGIAPVAFGGTDEIQSNANIPDDKAIILSNVASSYYLQAKAQSVLASFFLPGIGDVTITSPRAGIVRLGRGFFDEEVIKARNSSGERNARRTIQLASLFHEARHTDGHGKHLTFSHLACPQNHSFAGLAACDANLNGPYSVEMSFINSIDLSCKNCSIREHEILKMAVFDLATRIQKEVIDPTKDPVAVLKNIQMRASVCDTIKDIGRNDDMPEDLAQDCAQLDSLRATAVLIKAGKYPIPTIPSTEWDPAPEGRFDLNKDVSWLK